MSIQEDILEGLMLSDLSIPSPRKETQNTFMTLTTIHKGFADHLLEVLDSEGFKIYERKARVSYDKKLNKIFNHKTSYYVQTLVREKYKRLRELWYTDKKKIVPKTINLNPISLKYMFYGDGCCSKYGKGGLQITIATNSFTLDECTFIKELLLSKYNLHFIISKVSKSESQYILRLQIQKDVKLFFEIIGESIPCFEYKWKLKQNEIINR
jgi:hypothetical protein